VLHSLVQKPILTSRSSSTRQCGFEPPAQVRDGSTQSPYVNATRFDVGTSLTSPSSSEALEPAPPPLGVEGFWSSWAGSSLGVPETQAVIPKQAATRAHPTLTQRWEDAPEAHFDRVIQATAI
jgi:hypothetical protein